MMLSPLTVARATPSYTTGSFQIDANTAYRLLGR
jgi:hypothetical protein